MYLAWKANELGQSYKARNYFNPDNEAALQLCCLVEHRLKGIQWDNMNKKEMMSRNICSLICLSSLIGWVGYWACAKLSYIRKNFSLC